MHHDFGRTAAVFCIVSISYFIACFISVALIKPLLFAYAEYFPPYVNLLFLPHGVRVLAAWLLGWRAIIYLFPITYICGQVFYFSVGPTIETVIGPMVGVASTVVLFWLARTLIPNSSLRLRNTEEDWQYVVLIGCTASAINTVMLAILAREFSLSILGIFVGDVTGMITCMWFLMQAFKIARIRNV